jgi:hypothetical protein
MGVSHFKEAGLQPIISIHGSRLRLQLHHHIKAKVVAREIGFLPILIKPPAEEVEKECV